MADDSNISWVPVPEWDGFFVTEDGQIRGPSGKVLKPMPSETGHLYVTRGRKSRKLYIHRAMLLAFVGPPAPGQEGRHLNGNSADNRLQNLKWGNRFEQRDDDRRNGVSHEHWPILPERTLKEIQAAKGIGSSRVVARRFGLSHTTILRFWRAAGV